MKSSSRNSRFYLATVAVLVGMLLANFWRSGSESCPLVSAPETQEMVQQHLDWAEQSCLRQVDPTLSPVDEFFAAAKGRIEPFIEDDLSKGALATGAALTAFVTSPEAFLDGTATLTSIVADAAIRPLAETPKAMAVEAARSINGTLFAIMLTVIVAGTIVMFRSERRLKARVHGWLRGSQPTLPRDRLSDVS